MATARQVKRFMNHLIDKGIVSNQQSFGESLGYTNKSSFSQLLNKEEVTRPFLDKLNNIYPDFEDWLKIDNHNNNSMLNDDGKKVSILKPNKDAPELTGYYYPNVSASAGLDISTLNQELEKVPIYLPNFGKGIDFINVYGDSMYPKYNAGEIIGIKLIEFQYLNYGYPYVVIFKNGDAYIKYVKKGKDENHVLLESENTFYEPREFNIDLIQNFYSIRGVIKKEMM